jgi:hypothetical protein
LPDQSSGVKAETSADDEEWKEKSILHLVKLHAENQISLDQKKKLANLVFQGNKSVYETLNSVNKGKSSLTSLIDLANV